LRSFSRATAVAHHDPSSLLQALDNLVGNAVKFAPENGTVTIDVRAAGDRWRIAVEDNGPGIPPGLRARVFERFYRVVGNESPGSGLGLGIVQQIVKLHKAKIYLNTPPGGQGLEVIVEFPVDPGAV